MPNILWMSPYCLHDTSSGASINAFQLLQHLHQQGYTVWSCSGFCCDNPGGAKQLFQLLKYDPNYPKRSLLTLDDAGIHFVFIPTEKTGEFQMTLAECQMFFRVYCQILDEFKPDFIIGYGLSPLPMMCRHEARRRGIKAVHMLCNGEQKSYTFPDMDLVIVDSIAMNNTYAKSDLLNTKINGIFLDIAKYISPVHKPSFITFINPSPAKGVSIFAKLLTVCEQEMPDLKFLTIESRASFYNELARLHTKGQPDEHPLKGKLFKNLIALPIQSNMKNVYAVTRALLAPSLWFEAWGRVTSESVLNHIPVLSSTSGGLPEAMGACGICIETPQHCKDDYFSLPTDEEIRPWVEGLKQLLAQDWTEQFKRAEQALDPKVSTLRCMKWLQDAKPSIGTDIDFTIPFNPTNLFAAEAPTSLKLQAAPSCGLAQNLWDDMAGKWSESQTGNECHTGDETGCNIELPPATLLQDWTLADVISADNDKELSTVDLPPIVDAIPDPILTPEVYAKYTGQGVYQEPVPVFTPDDSTLLGALNTACKSKTANQNLQDTQNKSLPCPAKNLAQAKANAALPRDGWVDKCNNLDLNALVDILQRASQAL